MFNWIQKSLNIANGKGYLDRLQKVYPINQNDQRLISNSTVESLKKALDNESNSYLIREFLKLEKFPIDDPYIGVLRMDPELLDKNPMTVNRIGNKLRSIGFDELISLAKSPMTPSRQMGNSFRNWLRLQSYEFRKPLNFHEASESKLLFLDGNDENLKYYVNHKLGMELGDTRKGIDFVFRKRKKFCIGETKFITNYGGTQTNQLDVALDIADMNQQSQDIFTAAILDGVVWYNNTYLGKIKKRPDLNIMTCLLFQEFVESF